MGEEKKPWIKEKHQVTRIVDLGGKTPRGKGQGSTFEAIHGSLPEGNKVSKRKTGELTSLKTKGRTGIISEKLLKERKTRLKKNKKEKS